MNINTKLNLNKHPKDNLNLSFVNALNVKVSQDESCITNEECISENKFISNYLTTYYGGDVRYKIIGIIPCNNELVIVVQPANNLTVADIFRYREGDANVVEGMYCAYGGIGSSNRLKYSGGKINGAFTYNVENSLIISIAEHSVTDVKIPLRTVNLGNYDDSTIYNDKNLSDDLLSISPKIRLPEINNLKYAAGSAYKGWYYMFIRYKINSVDYTQWYSIGFPIYVDTLEQFQIIKYCYNRDTRFNQTGPGGIALPNKPSDGYGAGASDYFSNNSDIAKETFKVDIAFDSDIKYSKYQIGLVCASKSYIKPFRTADIYIDKNYKVVGNTKVQEYYLDNKSLIEYDAGELIIDNYNYFNVKKVINYKNKLYISNYLENSGNNRDIPQSIVDAITVSLNKTWFKDYGLVYDTSIINKDANYANQYESQNMTSIPLHKYLGVPENTFISVTDSTTVKQDKANHFFIMSESLPNYAYIQHRQENWMGGYIATNFGKDSAKDVIITIPNKTTSVEVIVKFNTRGNVLNGGARYYNVETSFNNRKQKSTLIPGELYNFFIHYVDEYGHATNGYKINNNIIWSTEDEPTTEIIPVPFVVKVGGVDTTYYAAVLLDSNVAIYDYTNGGYDINVGDMRFYKDISAYGNVPKLLNRVDAGEVATCQQYIKEYFSSYADQKFENYKWYQVSFGPKGSTFNLFVNNNGDRLFRVPFTESFNVGMDGFYNDATGYTYYNTHTIFNAAFSNVEIPKDYVGYYISYEKYEPTQRATGILTRNDFRSQDWINAGASVNRITANSAKANHMMFYSSSYDISDSIKLDYNIFRVEGVNVYKRDDIPVWDFMQRNNNFNFMHDCNKPQEEPHGTGTIKTYAMPEYKIAVANSAADNRMGMGTGLSIQDSYNMFPSYVPTSAVSNLINLYRVTILNTSRNIYMSNNKQLVRLTDVKYRQHGYSENAKYSTGVISTGYNGRHSFDGVIVYENAGIKFNTTDNKITKITNDGEYYLSEVPEGSPHVYQNDIPFFAYMQFPVCSDIFFESKSYKASPKGIVYLVKTEGNKKFYASGVMVTPSDSIDLFENRQGSSDQFNTKTYVNYREDLVSVEEFNKTVRRSNVIQDESRANGWRKFPIEAYKNITENKGRITNLIGIGTVLLVHTEHSLFMFNTDNTLKTEGKDIQLTQPDAFEIDYKEVLTSDLGYGGLQDSESFTLDQFGYIFYSTDVNRFYHFDNNQLDTIDEDILQWLAKYKPYNVRFANDKFNHRLIIKMDYTIDGVDKTTLISYNYNVKNFISQHSYYFDKAYSTKVGLYMQCDNNVNGGSLHNFKSNVSEFGEFDNIKDNVGVPTVNPSKISVIINNEFKEIKFLEFISYKLTKYVDDTNIDFTHLPVEEYKVPYSGDIVKVYNNETNTGDLDITVDDEVNKNVFANFDKPYWELGVWNYSYLRNNISKFPTGPTDDQMTRIFGNYFIVEFTFNNQDKRKVEFEELSYNISK